MKIIYRKGFSFHKCGIILLECLLTRCLSNTMILTLLKILIMRSFSPTLENGRVNKPKQGAALLAFKNQKLLLPVAIVNSHKLISQILP